MPISSPKVGMLCGVKSDGSHWRAISPSDGTLIAVEDDWFTVRFNDGVGSDPGGMRYPMAYWGPYFIPKLRAPEPWKQDFANLSDT